METEDALQSFIDSRIKPELQEFYPDRVNCYRAGWMACLESQKQKQPEINRRPRTVDSIGT